MKELRNIRKARGLTVQACADAMTAKGYKVSHQKWTRWEGLRTDPSRKERDAIADLLGVTLDQLAGRAEFALPAAAAS